MRIEKTPMEKVHVRCEDCMKTLWRYSEGLITQAMLSMAESKGTYHERRHPTHRVEILVYENAPEEEVNQD